MSKRVKLGILGLVLAVILALIGVGSMTSANATGGDEPCTEVITVVDEEAWTEVVEHPEVTETIHHEAVTETTPAIWANWSPNNTQGPQDYVPVWPTDPRGTWHVHSQGIPPGHAGPDGVYQQGGGNSPYFYRQAEKVVVIAPAYDEVVVVEEAWTETIEHPAVTHEETVEVDCPPTEEPCPDDSLILNPETGECEPVEPPVDPETPEEPPVNPETPEQPETPDTPDNPEIEVPDEPGEEITYQSFDGDGNLVEQRVSTPIPTEAKQEGL